MKKAIIYLSVVACMLLSACQSEKQSKSKDNLMTESVQTEIESTTGKIKELSNGKEVVDAIETDQTIELDEPVATQLATVRNISKETIELNELDMDSAKQSDEAILKELLPDEGDIFGISDMYVGQNTDEGIKVYYRPLINEDTDYSPDMPLRIGVASTKAKGKSLRTLSEESYIFIEYELDGKTFVTQLDLMAINKNAIELAGEIVDLDKLPLDGLMLTEVTESNEVIVHIMNENTVVSKTIRHSMEPGYEYVGIVVSDIDQISIFLKNSDGLGQLVIYELSTGKLVNTYEIPFAVDYVDVQNNTYFLSALDEEEKRVIYVCDRNFRLLNSYYIEEEGTKIEELVMDSKYAETNSDYRQMLNVVLLTDSKKFETEIRMSVDDNNIKLIELNESDKASISDSEHTYFVNKVADDYEIVDFTQVKAEDTYLYGNLYLSDKYLYVYIDDILNIVEVVDENFEVPEVEEFSYWCYGLKYDGMYQSSISLRGDDKLADYYNDFFESKQDYQLINLINNRDIYPSEISRDETPLLVETQEKMYIVDALLESTKEIPKLNLESEEELYYCLLDQALLVYNSQLFYSYNFAEEKWKDSEIELSDASYDFRDDELMCKTLTGSYVYNQSMNQLIEREYVKQSLYTRSGYNGWIGNEYYYNVKYQEFVVEGEGLNVYYTDSIPVEFNGVMKNIIDYKLIDDNEYFTELETNYLYMVSENENILVTKENVRTYDIHNNLFVYSCFLPKGQLILKDLETKSIEVIYENPVEYINIMDDNIYFLDALDNNLYSYDLKTKKIIPLTDTENIESVQYLEGYIVYEKEGSCYIADDESFETIESFEGEVKFIDREKRKMMFENRVLKFSYDFEKNTITFLGRAFDYYYLIDGQNGKSVYYGSEGLGSLTMLDKDPFEYENQFANQISTEEIVSGKYSLMDVSIMYGFVLYVYDVKTQECHYMIDMFDSDLDEGNYILYYNDKYIYYYKNDFMTKESIQWYRYELESNTEIMIEEPDSDGLQIYICTPRGA